MVIRSQGSFSLKENKETYSAAGEMWLSRSRHSRSLMARKTKLDDMFFLIFYLLV